MTFTEAAVEVLRRAGKPLHFREISEAAVRENLLSHVGQDPEVTMGQRLAAMAKREEERKVVAVAPEGTFALTEWGVPADLVVEPVTPPLHPAEDGEAQYRPREREPRPIHAQARKRMEVLQAEHEEGSEEVEAERRRAQGRPEKGQKRFPPPAEVVFEALAQRQSGAPLAELAQQLLSRQLLSDALVQDLSSLVTALLEDNRRRTEAGRKPAFIVDGDRVTLVEFPPPAAMAQPGELAERAPQTSLGRPMTGAQLVAEGRRAVVRALRRRLAELETAGFEQLCALLLQKMGMRDVRIAKRSKEGPLYLARQRRGVSDLRVAVKLVRGAREIGRPDVQELRKDLAHYSAQMGLVLAAGEAGREARSEASAAGQAPVALYAGDALPEEMIDLHVGVTVQLVEIPDVDEAFFAAAAKAQPGNPRDEKFRDEKFRDERPRDEKGRDEKGRDEKGRDEKGRDDRPRDDKPREERLRDRQRERHQEDDASKPPEPVAAEPAGSPADSAVVESAPAAEAAAQPEPASPPAAAEAPAEDPQKEGRRPRRGREERPRAMTPAEQAWGQPAGTLRMSHAAPAAAAEGLDAAGASAGPDSAASRAPSGGAGPADVASTDASATDASATRPASTSDAASNDPAGGDAGARAASAAADSTLASPVADDRAPLEQATTEPVAPPAEGDSSKAP